MNIICNNCTGARIYGLNGLKYNNPFQWNIIKSRDMMKLINFYDLVHFDKIKLGKGFYKSNIKSYYLDIDNKFKVYYIHYRMGKTKEIKKVGSHVYTSDIENYIIDKYNLRLDRLKNCNESPVFLISDNDTKLYSKSNIEFFCKLKSKYKIVILTEYKDFLKYNDEMHKIIYMEGTHLETSTVKMANFLYNKYNSEFLPNG